MTRYDEMVTKTRRLLDAERRCRKSGKAEMADIWYRKADALLKELLNTPFSILSEKCPAGQAGRKEGKSI